MKDENIVSQIVAAADLKPEDVVVEVGPGEGVMTMFLLEASGKVVAVEKDHRLIPILKGKFGKEIEVGKLELIEKDILEFDPSLMKFYKQPYKVVANIPYYITGQLLRMFLATENQPTDMVLLVQKEVADRIVAHDGKESLLSLSVKVFGTPKYVRTVGRGAFSPQPNVDSAVISITNISKKNLGGVNEDFFFKVIRAGFAHKRKQLLPNLSELFSKEKLILVFAACDIEPKSRAEDLSLPVWLKLCKSLQFGIQ